jgi:hypothetical protein
LGLALDAADEDAIAVEELMGLSGEEWVTLTVTPRANVQRLRLETMAPKAWLKHELTPVGELQVEKAATPTNARPA